MTKQLFNERKSQTNLTHQVEDRNAYQSYHLFDSHKMINQGEDSPKEEDSLEVEDSLEEEDSPEAEDTREEEECHPEDHQEAVGDHHHYLCHKPIKGSW